MTLIMLLAVGMIYAMITLEICLGIGLFIILVIVAVLPSVFLIGSRI